MSLATIDSRLGVKVDRIVVDQKTIENLEEEEDLFDEDFDDDDDGFDDEDADDIDDEDYFDTYEDDDESFINEDDDDPIDEDTFGFDSLEEADDLEEVVPATESDYSSPEEAIRELSKKYTKIMLHAPTLDRSLNPDIQILNQPCPLKQSGHCGKCEFFKGMITPDGTIDSSAQYVGFCDTSPGVLLVEGV